MTIHRISTAAARGGHAEILIRPDTLNPDTSVYLATGTAISMSHTEATAMCEALLDVITAQKRGQR